VLPGLMVNYIDLTFALLMCCVSLLKIIRQIQLSYVILCLRLLARFLKFKGTIALAADTVCHHQLISISITVSVA